MKTQILTAALATLALPALAIDGAYLGVQGGYDSVNVKQESNAFGGAGLSNTNNADGIEGGIYGGYGKTFSNHVYLGGELEVNQSGASMDPQFDAVQSKFKKDYSYGASARLGYNMNDCFMPYVRVGVNRARFEQVGANLDDKQTKTGMSAGVGAEYKLPRNWGVRAELVNTYYGRMDSSDSVSGIDSKINDRQARVGLAYYF